MIEDWPKNESVSSEIARWRETETVSSEIAKLFLFCVKPY